MKTAGISSSCDAVSRMCLGVSVNERTDRRIEGQTDTYRKQNKKRMGGIQWGRNLFSLAMCVCMSCDRLSKARVSLDRRRDRGDGLTDVPLANRTLSLSLILSPARVHIDRS